MQTRRKLALAAAVAAVPAAVAAGGDDPIYAAIRAHWEAELALDRACGGEPHPDTPNAQTPEWQAERATWSAGQEAAGEVVFAAQWAMLDIEPTTVVGALAFLDYVTEFSRNGVRLFSSREPEPGELGPDSVTFEDDAMRFASRSLKRLLSGGLGHA